MKMAVTGVGIVSPLGNNVPDNIQNLRDMVVPLADARIKDDPIASPLMKLKKIFHANYKDLNIDDLVPDRDQRYSDPICTTSLIACDEAVKMSGITLPKDTPVFVGSIQGGCISELDWVSDIINGIWYFVDGDDW